MVRAMAVFLLAAVPATAWAQTRPAGVEFTPFAAFRGGGTIARGTNDVFGDDVVVDESLAFGATLGVPLTRNLELEILAEHQPSDLTLEDDLFGGGDDIGDIGVSYFHAGLNYEFDASHNVRPFIGGSIGVGVLDLDVPGTDTEARLSGSLGGGVKYFVNRNFGFRFEGRGFWTNTDNPDYFFDEDEDFIQGEGRFGIIIAF